MKRKVTQIAVTNENVYALCDDGTIWNWNVEGMWKEWPPVEEIPDRPAVKNPHKAITPTPKSTEGKLLRGKY